MAIIQARMSSSRLPRKIALDIDGKCLLERVVGQVRRSRAIDELVVATSSSPDDEIVAMICSRLSVDCYRGSLSDVRSRFVIVGQERGAAIVVRVTADNPLTEPEFIDACVEALRREPDSAYATMAREKVPDGSAAEVFRLQALLDTLSWDASDYSREHVTPALRAGRSVLVVEPSAAFELGDYFVGIDTFDNYLHINRLFARYGEGADLLKKVIADVRRERSGSVRAHASGGP